MDTADERRVNLWGKIRWNIVFPVIHIILALLYGVFAFRYEELGFGKLEPVSDTGISETGEMFFHMFFSVIFGCLLILGGWQVLFLMLRKKRKLPFLLIVVAFLICLLVFPSNYSYEPDNFLSYSYAVRNMPDYWQSIYLGCLYRGCLMVFPHSMILPFVQLSSLFGALYYMSFRIAGLFGKRAAVVPYLLILLPEFLEIGVNPYRNCIYTLMCIWFYAILFLDCMEKKKRSRYQILFLGCAAAFLAVFRSEGIMALVVFALALLFVYGLPFKKTAACLAFCAMLFLLLAFPQKMGEKKYYGKDYSMINSMNILKTILADPNANYSYEAAGEDLTAINRIVPLDLLAVYGIHGYRENNFVNQGTINQSMASEENQRAFIRAAGNVVFHNMDLFFRDRLVMFCEANGVMSGKEDPYPTEAWNRMFNSMAVTWYYSYNEIISDAFPNSIFGNADKIKFSDWLTDFQTDYYNFMCEKGILLISRILVFILFPVLVIYNCRFTDTKTKSFFVCAGVALFMQLGAVILFCPEARGVYYYPSFFVMLVGCFLLSMDIVQKSRQVKMMLPPVTARL